jgi:OOP family OmpA-OmpF porin
VSEQRNRAGRGAESAKGVRPNVRTVSLLGLIVAFVVGGAVYAHAAFWADSPAASLLQYVKAEKKPAPNKQKAAPSGYSWVAVRGESGLKLRGTVASEEDRRTILGMVKANFPDLKVEEKLKIVEGGPPRERWLGAVSFGLQQLTHLKEGAVRIAGTNLVVAGEAGSTEDYEEIRKALAGPLPAGLTTKGDGVRPPIVDPFIFTADLGVNTLSLTGSVPSEDSRKQVRELSRQLFERPGLDDRLEVASGAPKNWDEAVTAALHALSKLRTGKVAVSGLAVSIEGVAPDKGTAVAVSSQLRRDLPKLFSTSESIKWKEATAPRDVAARVLPRIKTYVKTNDAWPKGELPPLSPLPPSE